MKNFILIFSCLVLSFSVNAQTKPSVEKKNKAINSTPTGLATAIVTPVEALSMKTEIYDFGKIPQGKPVTHIFEFTNAGKTPLTLTDVHASCGCTTPIWSKDAIKPGEKATITVGFNAAATGAFSKPITITYNEGEVKQLIIKGEVFQTPENSAPSNNAIKSLKSEY